MVEPERIQHLNKNPIRKKRKYVLYWMQASQRAEWNHALEWGVKQAHELKKPLLVFFGLAPNFPEARRSHYRFMLEGLRETKETLKERNIGMAVRQGNPAKELLSLARHSAAVVTDRGYLRIQREWRSHAASGLDCPLIQVESDAVVPIQTASGKEEYSAAALRKKIHPLLEKFLKPVDAETMEISSRDEEEDGVSLDNIDAVLNVLDQKKEKSKKKYYRGGMSEAKKRLKLFLSDKLEHYHEWSHDPVQDGLSNLSPYIHFGQISPLYIAWKVKDRSGPGKEAFLEELIIRRELSLNFVWYNNQYDRYSCLPDWARETLAEHADDSRDYLYRREDWEHAKTHDPYWNAAQIEMLKTGKMHGYMRMYWGKKILEWTRSPQEGFRTALSLNNHYELDGRDPNGYAGVAWCFGKHDRGWPERGVFGKVRYMNANGLKRKFDADAYVEKVNNLPSESS